MQKVLIFGISEIEPYINWLYFFHTWGLSGKPREEKERIQEEAREMLRSWQGRYHTHAVFALFPANGDGDDLVLRIEGHATGKTTFRIPMLRQQHPSKEGEPFLCLADFVRPLSSGVEDTVGAFCASVDGGITEEYRHDEYLSMLSQTLCDRLAEATAEKMHEDVRRTYWGYAPNERLTMEQTHREDYQGIRPAIGYPSLPDTSVNFLLDQLLDMKQVGVRLTETGMMTPHASVSGLMFAHPRAHYFELGKIGEDQLADYARRRGIPVELMRRFLQSSLLRK